MRLMRPEHVEDTSSTSAAWGQGSPCARCEDAHIPMLRAWAVTIYPSPAH